MVPKMGVAAGLVVLVMATLVAPAEAKSPLPDLHCGLVTTDVKLRQDLTCTEGVFTEFGSTTPIRIDLGGHALTVPPPGIGCSYRQDGGCAVRADGGPVTIVNGIINGSVGFPFWFDQTPAGGALAHVTVNGNVIMNAGRQEVRNSTINGSVQGWGGQDIVDHSTINGSVSFYGAPELAFTRATISHNRIMGGSISIGAFGAENSAGGQISDNVVTGGGGILLSHDSGGIGATSVTRNRVIGSHGNGIELRYGSRYSYALSGPVTLRGNTVTGAGGHGIFFPLDTFLFDRPLTLIDGGGNTAAGSGVLPNCVGLVCGPGDLVYPRVSWPTPAPIVYGTPLGASQLNARASVPGTFTYDPSAGTVLGPGRNGLIAHFEPLDRTRYLPVDFGVVLQVLPLTAEVSWPDPAPIVFGTPLGPDQLNAVADVPGTLTYSPPAGTLLQPGAGQVLRVTFSAPNYTSVTLTRTIDVLPVPGDAVTWATPADIPYGSPLGPAQLNATANLAGRFTYSALAGTVLDPGPHELSVVFTPTDSAHHAPLTATVTLNVLPPSTPPVPIVLTDGGTTALAMPSLAARAADLDGDGVSDLVTVSRDVASDLVSVQLGNGDGTFGAATTHPVATPAFGGYRLTLGDLNADDRPDIVVSRTNADLISVLLSADGGTFDAPVTYPTGARPAGAVIGDIDADGEADVVVSNNGSASVSVFLGVGDGALAPKVDYSTGTLPNTPALGDLDGDDHLDLVVPLWDLGSVAVLRGVGDGTFEAARRQPVGGGPEAVALDDLDGDGALDMVVANGIGQNFVVLRGVGTGGFGSRTIYPVGLPVTDLEIADLNLDGEPDVVVHDTRFGSTAIRLGLPGGLFGPLIGPIAGPRGAVAAIADVDGDDRVDVLLVAAAQLSVLRNEPAP